jgi:hypothetical protein
VYLLRVVTRTQHGAFLPNAKIPTVLLPAAEPKREPTVAAPPALTTQPEYVYLLRVVTPPPPTHPNAKMPTVQFPAAEPLDEAAVAALPALTAQLEKVYLSRVVTRTVVNPSANIPTVPGCSAGVTLLLNALMGDGP